MVYRSPGTSFSPKDALSPIPVTVWIWDIPFTDRVICYGWHNGRLKIGDFPSGSKQIYLLSGVLFVGLLVMPLTSRLMTRVPGPTRILIH